MKPASQTPLALSIGNADWLAQFKDQIAQVRQRAAMAANAVLSELHRRIGNGILQRRQTQGWGAKVIDQLSHDLKNSLAGMRGFSTCNLKCMALFAEHCPYGQFGQQPADQLPWFHNHQP